MKKIKSSVGGVGAIPFISDRGKEFTSNSYRQFLESTNVGHEVSPSSSAEAKPVIEEFFRKLSEDFILIDGEFQLKTPKKKSESINPGSKN